MPVDSATLHAAIEARIRTVAPPFTIVYPGRPPTIETERTCTYWYVDSTPWSDTLGDVGAQETYWITVWWPMPNTIDQARAREAEIRDTLRALNQVFWDAPNTLGVTGVAGAWPQKSEADITQPIGGTQYHIARLILSVFSFGEETK